MFILAAIIGMLLIVRARATPPECSLLFSFSETPTCQQRMAAIWLQAAQEEAARFYHTTNGGYLQPECTASKKRELVPAVQPFPWKQVMCIYEEHLPPETCHNKKCNFTSHPELFQSDDCIKKSENGAACRSIRSWLRIANAKLVDAIKFYQNCEYDKSLSASCVADYIFLQIAKHIIDIESPSSQYRFIDSVARKTQHYVHNNSALQFLTFLDTEGGGSASVEWINVQSRRTCGTNRTAALVTSLIMYTNFTAAAGSLENEQALQIVYGGNGVAPDFRETFADVDPANLCALRGTPTTFPPTFHPTWRLEQLTTGDFATVLFDGAEPRAYICLSISSSCPIVVLEDAEPEKRGVAVTQINFREPAAVEETSELDSKVNLALLFVDGSEDVCLQFAVSGTATAAPCNGAAAAVASTTTQAATALASTEDLQANNLFETVTARGIPLTLAPGESQCVGGDRHGARCSMPSECGKGFACRRKPFSPRSVAFCYDGERWDQTRPCAFADADDECPFGECFGAANDKEGGAFPFYYFYILNNCTTADDGSSSSSAVCREEHVADWTSYPNPNIWLDVAAANGIASPNDNDIDEYKKK